MNKPISQEEYDKLPEAGKVLYMHGYMQSLSKDFDTNKLNKDLEAYLTSKNISPKDTLKHVSSMFDFIKQRGYEDNR